LPLIYSNEHSTHSQRGLRQHSSERFEDASFECDEEVGFIEIFDGKEDSPHGCYAAGWLYSEPWGVLVRLEEANQKPKPHSTIQFEYCEKRSIAPPITISGFGANEPVASAQPAHGDGVAENTDARPKSWWQKLFS